MGDAHPLQPGTSDGPLHAEISGTGTGDGVQVLVEQLAAFCEALDEEQQYELTIELIEQSGGDE
jgi:hypothetical protein